MEETRVIEVKEEILAENTAQADLFRAKLAGEGTYYIDIMSSPGAGKTTLLLALIERLRTDSEIGIIEADLESFVDSKKI
ncbi:MAG: GTP-binding protein, partial [Coriobacteriaceae bacterium]|nr:GTP-binding protein [Coriobacteriaceae bacterium]